MQRTDIEWADYSTNPLKLKLRESGNLVNACIRCSPGCIHCYAESNVRRWWRDEWGPFPGYRAALMKMGDPVLHEPEIHKMLTFRPKGPFKSGDRPGVFPFDMTDAFGEWVPFELIDRLFAVFALRPDVDWMVLTKRPERAVEYFDGWKEMRLPHVRADRCARACGSIGLPLESAANVWAALNPDAGPLPNVWIGTSVEDQQRADERIPHLLRCPAAVRFLSIEPLIGPVDLNGLPDTEGDPSWGASALHGVRECPFGAIVSREQITKVDWIIVGAESGPGRRPMKIEWARSLREQCASADVAFFMKQLEVDGKITGDIERFPEDLRVREWPKIGCRATAIQVIQG